ncbi:uncharacterized protein SPSC_05298 [Sporisorium scitamineum]|uniref:Uncharacterized protein n=1 Tax=Sporisorium scitamineum TaxID=49012 RepID=A0A0F7RTG8_9BASI|nr:hypothetical protein [Sporisorium scitamineum]CDU25405.1 uncharacterized protein SPSC_05298 [Sporisorium scitamineum]
MHTTATTQTPTASNTTPDLVGVLVVLLKPSTTRDQQRFEDLQILRRRHDQAFDRWLPHITLVPPFTLSSSNAKGTSALEPGTVLEELAQLHAEKLSQIVKAAAETCSKHSNHQLLLDQVSTFPLRKYTNVHLRPAPTNFHDKRSPSSTSPPAGAHSSHRIVELQSELSDSLTPLLRATTKIARRRETFKPHVSVGQSTSVKAAWQLCRSAEMLLKQQGGPGLLCDVDRVQFMIKPKGFQGAYHVHKELHLSSNP